MRVMYITLQIAVLSSVLFHYGVFPAAAQFGGQTAEPATPPAEEDAPGKNLHAYGTLSLEQAIAQSLRTNPELLIADAKVRQAKAELNRARLTVVRDVTVAYQNWMAAKQDLPFSEKMSKQGKRTTAEVLAAKQKLAGCEYELMYLLGASAEASSDDAEAADAIETQGEKGGLPGVVFRNAGQPAGRPEIPQRYQEVMKLNVELNFIEQPLSEVLEYLKAATEGEISFMFKDPNEQLENSRPKLNFQFRVTIAAALEAVADQTDVCFVFRDYGVLVVSREDAWQYRGAAIPNDTPLKASGGEGGGGMTGGGGYF